eukprot:gene9779-20340_t
MSIIDIKTWNDSFSFLRYSLLRCLPKDTYITEFNASKIENISSLPFYKRRLHIDVLKHWSWVEYGSIKHLVSLETICNSGFPYDFSKSYEFNMGMIDLGLERSSEIELTLIYCEVAVGDVFVFKDGETVTELPLEYSAAYKSLSEGSKETSNSFSLQKYKSMSNSIKKNMKENYLKYRLKDPLQACPRYIVRVKLRSHREQQHGFRQGCSLETIRVESPLIRMDNGTRRLQYPFYDATVQRPVSAREKQSREENDQTTIVTVQKAFEQATTAGRSDHPDMTSMASWLEQHLDMIENKHRDIQKNYEDTYNAIIKAAEKAISQLQSLTDKKLRSLLSLELELRRQRQQISVTEENIRNMVNQTEQYLRQHTSEQHDNYHDDFRLSFLKDYRAHLSQQSQIIEEKAVYAVDRLGEIEADMAVVGHLTVSCVSASSHGTGTGTTHCHHRYDNVKSTTTTTTTTRGSIPIPFLRSPSVRLDATTSLEDASSGVKQSRLREYMDAVKGSGTCLCLLPPMDLNQPSSSSSVTTGQGLFEASNTDNSQHRSGTCYHPESLAGMHRICGVSYGVSDCNVPLTSLLEASHTTTDIGETETDSDVRELFFSSLRDLIHDADFI